ncbi:hypothetical protein [Haloferax sp. KTX1]|uniref:hypothetical protein n=1 Tax=Haloferax sp. KTX1 TaxID=2600597 RepID=UPI0011DE1745|nr:hypothetical protein [Haloferax sp. KTX1]
MPTDPVRDPPAYHVYERDALPGHLALIANVLADIGQSEGISDVTLSHHAVQSYFCKLTGDEWTVATGEIRQHVDDADGYRLAKQSLIDGYETRDVLVATTALDRQRIKALVDAFHSDTIPQTAYDELADCSELRVSLPAEVVQDTPRVERLDGREDEANGTQVYWYTGEEGLVYDLTGGGLRRMDDQSGDSSL